jgi:hypothetical protein
MSNAYTNQILFGHSSSNVDGDYINGLMPLMFTSDKTFESIALDVIDDSPPPPPVVSRSPCHQESKPAYIPLNAANDRYQNSIFWSIYEVEHPTESFLGTRANTEIEHRIKVVDYLKKTPKRLKETNSKLTIEQTQALFGSMLISKEDKLDFCIAYAAYYNKPILVIYTNTYCIFSPTVEIDLSEGDAIILYASNPTKNRNKVVYSSEKTPTISMIQEIQKTKVASPLKAMSNYKTNELDEIAARLGISIKQNENGKEKRRKKEDIYNELRVAIHQDQTNI